MSLDDKTSFIQKKRTENNNLNGQNPNILFIAIKKKKLGKWDPDEDLLLKKWVEENGPRNWTQFAEKIQNRTGKQCRERWLNNLNTNLKKKNWTTEEDLLILRLFQRYKSWIKILPVFENRSENSIKNRYYIQLRKIALRKNIYGNTDNVLKIGIETLKQYFDEAVEEAEKKYLNKNKNMTKEKFETFFIEIVSNLNDIKKGKTIDLNSLREKLGIPKEDNKEDNIFDNDSISYEEAADNEKEIQEKLKQKMKLNYKGKKSKKENKKKAKQSEVSYPNIIINSPSGFVPRRSIRIMEKQLNKNNNYLSLNNSKNDNAFEVPLNSTITFYRNKKSSIGLINKDSIFYTPFGYFDNYSRNKEFSKNMSWKLEPNAVSNYIPLKSNKNSSFDL